MKGNNGIQMSLDMRFHKIFKEMKRNCSIKNSRDIGDKRFSIVLAKFLEQNIKGSRDILENAEVKDE